MKIKVTGYKDRGSFKHTYAIGDIVDVSDGNIFNKFNEYWASESDNETALKRFSKIYAWELKEGYNRIFKKGEIVRILNVTGTEASESKRNLDHIDIGKIGTIIEGGILPYVALKEDCYVIGVFRAEQLQFISDEDYYGEELKIKLCIDGVEEGELLEINVFSTNNSPYRIKDGELYNKNGVKVTNLTTLFDSNTKITRYRGKPLTETERKILRLKKEADKYAEKAKIINDRIAELEKE